MATVDKLTLQLNANGVEKFLKNMKDIEDALKKAQDDMHKTTEKSGLMDSKLSRSSKKKSKIDKKREQDITKSFKMFNENSEKSSKSLIKMSKALLAVAGVSFGVNGILSGSNKSAMTSTGYANRARNSTATAQQLEALDNTARAENVSAGALNEWAEKFSLNQSAYKSGKSGGVPEVQTLIGALNGLGAKIDARNTDPIGTMKAVNEFLLTLSPADRASVLKDRAGLTGDAAIALSSNTFSENLNKAMKHTIQTPERIEAGRKNQADLTFSWVDVQNQLNQIGENLTPVAIAFNDLSTTILTNLNPAIKEFGENLTYTLKSAKDFFNYNYDPNKKIDLPKEMNNLKDQSAYKIGAGMASSLLWISLNQDKHKELQLDVSKVMDNFDAKFASIQEAQNKSISEYENNISSIDKESGVITFKNGDTYGGDWFDKLLSNFKYPTYLTNRFDEMLSSPEATQQLMAQNYSAQNNSNSQVISINEMHVRTDASNVPTIVNDGLKSTHLLVGSAANILPFMPSTK